MGPDKPPRETGEGITPKGIAAKQPVNAPMEQSPDRPPGKNRNSGITGPQDDDDEHEVF